ncbi:MAG TPA: thiamine diphosphokinase [Candidatus Limnocylindrales bacterium]|nr:thiamine diphosphokinase [Candidatus Limnocylindrales bacterium]
MPTARGPVPIARHALVVADGDVPSRAALDAAWPGWDDGVVDVVAADGGFARARALGLEVALLVGDLDSLDPGELAAAEAKASMPEIRRVPAAKDESDTELAILAALERGASRITLLGAFGGPRLDHALANVWLLAHPALADADLLLLDERTRVSLVSAPGRDGRPVSRPLPGPTGGTVSLLPFAGDVAGLTTHGLRYPLRDEPLRAGPARGLSNVREDVDAGLSLRAGRLLVVETAG